MQWYSQDKADFKRLMKEQDQCCQWLVKWSAGLVRQLSRNRQARWQMRGLWYSLFHTSGHHWDHFSFFTTFSVCTKHLNPACWWQWGKTDRFSLHFSWSLPQISFQQHDGTPFLIPSGKQFWGMTSLVFTLSPPCFRFRRRRFVKWNVQLSFGSVLDRLFQWCITFRQSGSQSSPFSVLFVTRHKTATVSGRGHRSRTLLYLLGSFFHSLTF